MKPVSQITLGIATIKPIEKAVEYGLPTEASLSFLLRASRPDPEVDDVGTCIRRNDKENIGLVASYQAIYEESVAPFICFAHDDVTVNEDGWNMRVLHEFEDPNVAVVGFGGAMGIGTNEIYKVPYSLQQLQRIDYYSNQVDHEIHGKRETGARNIAVVDGFVICVRRSFLDQIGGWKWFPHRFHMYDVALCLMAHRHGWKVRMVGVSVTHHGGGTSTTPEYVMDCRERGTSVEAEHTEPHVWCYNEFRDLLPLRVK